MTTETTELVETRQLCTFAVNNQLLGVDVTRVQEVIRQQTVTEVPLAPAVVRGLINLRGQIVMAIDLRRRLSLPELPLDQSAMNVVVSTADGPVSLLVDEIGDVIEVSEEALEELPPTLPAPLQPFLQGIYKLERGLILVLDVDRATNLSLSQDDAIHPTPAPQTNGVRNA